MSDAQNQATPNQRQRLALRSVVGHLICLAGLWGVARVEWYVLGHELIGEQPQYLFIDGLTWLALGVSGRAIARGSKVVVLSTVMLVLLWLGGVFLPTLQEQRGTGLRYPDPTLPEFLRESQ